MRLLKITPCDNTFFGSGSPFNMGDNNFIESKNTPYSTVFSGAIFSALLAINEDFKNEFMKKQSSQRKQDHLNIMRIGNMYLYDSENLYVSAPKDIFINSKNIKRCGKFNKCTNYNSLSLEYILESPKDKDFKRIKNKYIKLDDLYDSYSKRQGIRILLKDEEDIFKKNIKIGLSLDKYSRTAEEGKLYKIEQTEFTDSKWSFIIEYDIDDKYLSDVYKNVTISDLTSGYLKLGGENKVCKYEEFKSKKIDKFKTSIQEMNLENSKFKILFLSDTFFEKDIIDEFKEDFNILGIANYKPIYAGGFSIAENKAISMKKGYSAGTVFLVEAKCPLEKVTFYLNKIIKPKNANGYNQYIIIRSE